MSTLPSRRHRIEGWLLALFMRFFGGLPFETASAIGGWLGRALGPRLGITRIARRNLARALPDLEAECQAAVVRQMWDNLGRVIAEYPHLPRLRFFEPGTRVMTHGMEHVAGASRSGRPIIFFSAHYGNWELNAIAAVQYGLDVAEIYRAANNPVVENWLSDWRHSLGLEAIPKGRAGARRMIAALREGKAIAMLVDQKMNDGIAVPFFGRDAMTASAIAELALRFDAWLIPARVIREAQAHFTMIVEPPLAIQRTANRQDDVRTLMTRINQHIEGWIRADPGQWFWLHRRWPD